MLFSKLGLPSPDTIGNRYPHQVSGGQLQRCMTAMALCPKPDLVIFDEPTTALDVTAWVDVLAAIKEAIRDTQVAALYITHDLAVVAQVADEIMVLRHGRMVELGDTGQIIKAPREDYTKAGLGPGDRAHRKAARPADPASAERDGALSRNEFRCLEECLGRPATRVDVGGGRRKRFRQVNARPRDHRAFATDNGTDGVQWPHPVAQSGGANQG